MREAKVLKVIQMLIKTSGHFSPDHSVRTFFINVMLVGLLRYAHVIEKHENSILNTFGLLTAWICAAGLIMVGNFQVDFAKVLHYIGAGVAFPCSMLFVCLQSALTYRLAKTQEEYCVGHLRVGMALVALVALVLSGVFFCQESFVLQHASAIFEWLYCILIMLFYGTFAFEFGDMSGDTLLVLSRRGRSAEVCLREQGRGGLSMQDVEASNVRMGEEAKGWKLQAALKLFHAVMTKE